MQTKPLVKRYLDIPNAKYEEIKFSLKLVLRLAEKCSEKYTIRGTIDGKRICFAVIKMLN
jgi:hypothetical protein